MSKATTSKSKSKSATKVNNQLLAQMRSQVKSAKNATERKKLQASLNSLVKQEILNAQSVVVTFENDKNHVHTRIFSHAEKKRRMQQARKSLRSAGYRTMYTVRFSVESNVSHIAHELEYTGKHDAITNDFEKHPVRDYEQELVARKLKEAQAS